MRNYYEDPEVTLIRFSSEDIITTSGDGGFGEVEGGDEDLG